LELVVLPGDGTVQNIALATQMASLQDQLNQMASMLTNLQQNAALSNTGPGGSGGLPLAWVFLFFSMPFVRVHTNFQGKRIFFQPKSQRLKSSSRHQPNSRG